MNCSGEDRDFMGRALAQAERAALAGEVPVGAVWVIDGEVVAEAHNRKETAPDPTAHAEIEALRLACRKMSRWRLGGTVYVTLEPCAMCAGALVSARVARLVFGATDPKAGACGSLFELIRDPRIAHRMEVVGGVMAEASSRLLHDFFRQQRQGTVPES